MCSSLLRSPTATGSPPCCFLCHSNNPLRDHFRGGSCSSLSSVGSPSPAASLDHSLENSQVQHLRLRQQTSSSGLSQLADSAVFVVLLGVWATERNSSLRVLDGFAVDGPTPSRVHPLKLEPAVVSSGLEAVNTIGPYTHLLHSLRWLRASVLDCDPNLRVTHVPLGAKPIHPVEHRAPPPFSSLSGTEPHLKLSSASAALL